MARTDSLGNIHRYGPEGAGYLPICLNQVIQSPSTKYQIIHKLGMGTNAICWLAYNHDPEVSDPAYGPPTGGKIVPFNSHCRHFPTNDPIPYKPRRYVALKIINTIQFNDNGPDSEFVCHRHLNENAPGVAPMVYESFEIKDAVRNMKHRCIAMEIVGPTIFTMMKNINPHMPHLPIELSRRYGARFLEAVEKMHRVGVVHGDLHANNIVVGRMNGIQYLKIWDIYNLVGGAPKEVLTPPQWLWENPHLPESRIPILNLYKLRHLCGNPEDVDTIIIDFGSAWKGEYNKRTKMVKNNRIPRPVEPWGPGTPWSISSPELCLKIALNQGYSVLDSWKGKRNVLLFPLSAASEMWTVACTLYVIFGKGDLFCWYPEDPDDWMPGAGERHLDNVYKSLGILCDHVALLKKMPARWWEAWWKFGTGAPDWVWQYAQYQWTKTATPRRSYAAQRRGLSLPIRIAQTRLDDITGTEEIPLGDWSSLCRLIGSCLKWEPAKRATAKDVAAMIPNDWKYGREPPRPQKRKASIDENCDECDTQPVKKIRNTTRPFGVAKMRRRK